jgi:hypothetical protein
VLGLLTGDASRSGAPPVLIGQPSSEVLAEMEGDDALAALLA